jgi:thiol-disulfide isomerase/thioredoxin
LNREIVGFAGVLLLIIESMKMKIISILTGAALLVSSASALADGGSVTNELKDLVTRINAKLEADKKTESDLAPELKEFDQLMATHKDANPEELAQVLSMKAGLYMQVLNQPEKAVEIFKQVKTEFPDTRAGKRVDSVLAMIAQQAEAKKIQATLVEGTAFPDFNEVDMAGKPLSIANLKGKVVLLDFWATWCGPCRAELPNVLEVYQKHHKDGFEIIGISLDDDKAKTENFTKEKTMAWPQYFDGQKWKNKLAVKYGINSIPATFLLDGDGKILGKDLRGEELEKAVAAALAKK